jgi:DNA-3-methyladenine glycosylase II
MRKAVKHLRATDPTLAAIIDKVGPYRIEYLEPAFRTLVRAIIYQQLSGKAAATIMRRLETAVGRRGVTPRAILSFSPEELRALGISPQKQRYLIDLAEKTATRRLRFNRLPDLSDEEVLATLTEIKGVGVWTAQMFLIFALRRTDVFAPGDLGIRNAIHRAYKLSEPPNPGQMEQLAERWRPYRTVACWYLWRSLSGEANLE